MRTLGILLKGLGVLSIAAALFCLAIVIVFSDIRSLAPAEAVRSPAMRRRSLSAWLERGCCCGGAAGAWAVGRKQPIAWADGDKGPQR